MSELPAEKVAELRQAIHSQVNKMGIQEQIQRCLADSPDRPMNEDGVLALLENRGLVDRVMESLQLGGVGEGNRDDVMKKEGGNESERREVSLGKVGRCKNEGMKMEHVINEDSHLDQYTGEEVQRKGLNPNRRCLLLRVNGGRAFLDHLQHSHSLCASKLTVHICFRGQRVHSRPVACACEPNFSESFLLELIGSSSVGGEVRERVMSYSDALSISEPISLIVTRSNDRGCTDLLGTHSLDWRPVLMEEKGRWSGTVELCGVGHEAKISSGLLELKIEIFPKSAPLQAAFLTAQRETERRQISEREKLFLVYSKQWWKEYLQIRPEHQQRLVKIFALDETGRSRSVSSFVWPLRAGRLLDGPRQAARFVSLIPFERSSSSHVGVVTRREGGGEVWSSLHTILCQRKGDIEDHCCLLCSLLLGYGLETYICLGTKTEGLAHCWVATIGSEGTITFWESLTGQRYRHVPFDPNTQAGAPPPAPRHPYRTIDCVFNHTSFLANAQPSNSLLTCSLDLRNRSSWKQMSSEAIQSVARQRKSQLSWCLLPSLVDPLMTANTIELELRTLLTQHRSDLGLNTVWDNQLSYLLIPALASYELERYVGISVGNEEFQDAIRCHVHDGHTFKGFPIQLTHKSPHRIFNTCLRSPVCSSIVSCRGDEVRHAIRVKIYCYPEDIMAIWIMFAVTYHSIL